MFAKTGPNKDPIATPTTCFQYLLITIQQVYLVAMLSKLQKSCFGKLGGFPLSLYKLSAQILMVSSKGIFVSKKSMSRPVMCRLKSCSQISFKKWNESMNVNSLVFEFSKNFSKNFTYL